MDKWTLARTDLGYVQVYPRPSAEDLARHYRERYYGRTDGSGQYAHAYTTEELAHKRLAAAETERVWGAGPGSVLEVGVGEGFTLDHLKKQGWRVGGVDFSADGLRERFPDLLSEVVIGDAFAEIDRLVAAGRRYDLLICNNVIEHVLDPEGLLLGLRQVVNAGGMLRIAAPNDGSWLQEEVVRRGLADPDFWVVPPEHLNYFTAPSLRAVLEANGWEVVDVLAEFPVDLFALNPDSAYTIDPSKGRNCHFARVAFEMALWNQGLERLIDFRRASADAGIGRNLIAYARPQGTRP